MLSKPRLPAFLFLSGAFLAAVPSGAQAPPPYSAPAPSQPQAQSQNPQRLTLAEAENIAVQNHPQIQAAAQLASAAAAQVKEVQSALLSSGERCGHRHLCRKQQPHRRWIPEQPVGLRQVCRRRVREPDGDRLWPDTRAFQEFALPRASGAGERHHHARRCAVTRQCVLLRRHEGPIRSSGRARKP